MFNESVWKYGENLACEYLKNNGYKILARNFKTKSAELDIVCLSTKRKQRKEIKIKLKNQLKSAKNKGVKKLLINNYKTQKKSLTNLLVIVEVKARLGAKFGIGLEAVDEKKQKQMKKGAQAYLLQKKIKNVSVRFDVASVDDGKISYFKDAF